ncbi:alpha/beta hydrolase [Streptomyces radicis]|uniref:Esterase family protein n=1 Tax=Streptomyces radicis TaxID=1750517 RepID=A0A3A9W2Q7_9ACTN|nr:alpha/beta hydrolase family protein [Streptomyces radicis]RKN07032.1 esterase family protein [Streptomyces radicis]RKN15093.1 esterase family protein [Streptomyces radicis]
MSPSLLGPLGGGLRARRAAVCSVLAALIAVAAQPAAAGSSAGGATVVTRERVDERVLDLTIASPALGTEVATRVLLPRGHADRPGRTWPVIYLLHGCCNATGGWLDWTGAADIAAVTADTEALIVMPEGGPVGYYSDWWNGGLGGPPAWETFHLVELPALLADEVGAGEERAVAGNSMGGTGALGYAARHPGFFRAAASYSGRLDTQADPAAVMNRLADFGLDPLALWGDPVAQEEIWTRHNPLALARHLPPGFPVYVSSGNGEPGPLDEPGAEHDALEAGFGEMAAAYVAEARARGVAVTANLYGPGTHAWPYWGREFACSLPLLARAIGAATSVPPKGNCSVSI